MPDDVTLARATPEDVRRVAENLRPEHRREAAGLSRLAAGEAVRLSVACSSLVLAGRAGGKAFCLAGVERRRLFDNAGTVWMLATPEIDGHALAAAVMLRDLFGRAHELAGAERLEQWLPVWYAKGIKWLAWLGWKRGERLDINGVPHWHMTHERAM